MAQWPNFWDMQAGNSRQELAAFAKGRPLPKGPQYEATEGTGILENWSLPVMHDFVDDNHLNTTFTMNSS